MKKIYIFLIVLLPVFAKAQITLTQADLPGVGQGYINAADNNYAGAIPAGGATSWNYFTLQNVTQDTSLFISATGTPYAGSFPGANLAQHAVGTVSYAYFIANSTGLLLNGVADTGNIFIYNPAQMIVPVPFTYNSTYSGYSRVQVDDTSQIPHTRIVIRTIINMLGDGYGQLTLPNMVVPATLRIKTTSVAIDSVFYDLGLGGGYQLAPGFPTSTQTTDFKWLRNGGGALLLDIAADSAGQTATSSSYLIFSGALGVNNISQPVSLKAFPNPASDRVTFNFDSDMNEAKTLEILNSVGQIIETYDATHLNNFTMTTSHLSNGMYSYLVQNKKGITSKGKFVVIH
jgi:hypothetical protein